MQTDIINPDLRTRTLRIPIETGDMPFDLRPPDKARMLYCPLEIFRYGGELYVSLVTLKNLCGITAARELAKSTVTIHKFDQFIGSNNQPVMCITVKDAVRLYDICIKKFQGEDSLRARRCKMWRKAFNEILLQKVRVLAREPNRLVYNNGGWSLVWHLEANTDQRNKPSAAPGLSQWLDGATGAEAADIDVEAIEQKGKPTRSRKTAILNAVDALYAVDMPAAKRRLMVAQLVFDS